MPVTIKKRGKLYRVVEAATGRIATTGKGTPRDGGGHPSRRTAEAQARAINANRPHKKKGH